MQSCWPVANHASTLRQRLAAPSALIDSQAYPNSPGSDAGELLSIGAMTRYIEIIESPSVRAKLPSLSARVPMVGDPLVRKPWHDRPDRSPQ